MPITTDEVERVDLRELFRRLRGRRAPTRTTAGTNRGYLTVRVNLQERRLVLEEAKIRLHTTTPHLGGERWWAQCPRCDRRIAILYRLPWASGFACRTCHGLVHRSAVAGPVERARLRYLRAREALGDRQPLLGGPLPPKPPDMHWSTWDRLTQRLKEAELQYRNAFAGAARGPVVADR